MGKRDRRERTQRRKRDRDARKLVRDRERLAALAPGGSPDHPIAVDTPAVVEVRAGGTRCVQCGEQVDVEEHAAERRGDELLRRVRIRCRRCHTERDIWFRIAPPLPN